MAISSLFEQFRLAGLQRLGLLDTAPEERFDRITRLAQEAYGAKVALVSLVDEDRQWFKSRQGVSIQTTPRAYSLCDHTIQQNDIFVVEDATQDPRFAANPLVTAALGLRFYAGVPLREPSGFKIGALCIIDDAPRRFGASDSEFLIELANLVEAEIARNYSDNVERPLFQADALNAALRLCRRRLLSDASDKRKACTILNQCMLLTGSAFGLISEITQGNEQGSFRLLCMLGHEHLHSPDSVETARKTGVIEQTLIQKLLGGELLSPCVSVPILLDGALQGVLVLAGGQHGYPGSLNYDLDPILNLAATALERRRLRAAHRALPHTELDAVNDGESPDLQSQNELKRLCEREIHNANWRGGSVSICYLDLDRFKDVNATYGRSVGDQVLRQAGERLRGLVRQSDILLPAGGDEFLVLLSDVGSNVVYQRILDLIAESFHIDACAIRLSASLGVSIYPNDHSDVDTLLRHARQAMLLAKDEGGDRYKIFDVGNHKSKIERLRLLDEISSGLTQGQFVLFLQPKIWLQRQSVAGFEALIRWQHPVHGLMFPDQFLPAIEGTPVDCQLGNFVLGASLELLQRFARRKLDYSLSINLSPHHFMHDGFLGDLNTALAHCSPEIRSKLTFEILETSELKDQEAAGQLVRACQEQGISVSLDDFGTGYSSLSYFRKLSLDEIKIDRSFVMDMMSEDCDRVIVETIVSLSKKFGRRVVAEGIESENIANRLRQLKCDVGQGYYYSRPVSVEQALIWAESFDKQSGEGREPVQARPVEVGFK